MLVKDKLIKEKAYHVKVLGIFFFKNNNNKKGKKKKSISIFNAQEGGFKFAQMKSFLCRIRNLSSNLLFN